MSNANRHSGSEDTIEQIAGLLLSLVPADGSPIGNTTLRREAEAQLAARKRPLGDEEFWRAQALLVSRGLLVRGKGRGGSVRRAMAGSMVADGNDDEERETLSLEGGRHGEKDDSPRRASRRGGAGAAGARRSHGETNQILSYRHSDKRVNNPEVGMVTPRTDPDAGKTRWAYDPHLDPVLQFDPQRSRIEKLIDDALASGDTAQMKAALEELKRLQSPYLNWAGKAERTSFEVDTVSLHVHERIDPASILSAVRKAMNGEGGSKGMEKAIQPGLFDAPFENLPLRDAIDFYRHEKGWANRLIAGDSLLVMNSLLQKESMAGKVQMIYIDPPYGINYGSNFQPFVGKRNVKDKTDADLTQEPETIKAFRDTWELGIHSYLTYLRDRLLLSKELLSDTGSIVIQISDENLHLVRNLLDEIFGAKNFFSLIAFKKTLPLGSAGLPSISDYLVWYAKDIHKIKFNTLYEDKPLGAGTGYTWLLERSGKRRKMTTVERHDGVFPEGARPFFSDNLLSSGYTDSCFYDINHKGLVFGKQKYSWKTNAVGMQRLDRAGRLIAPASLPNYVRYFDDFPVQVLHNMWDDTHGANQPIYVVQTSEKVVQRVMLMTTDPSDLVLDLTCGSGTTAYVAEKWGRRWITCDTSRVAITLAKQRLMTASYDYYELKYPHEGLKGGFIYKTVPHVTLKSIANNPEIDEIYERMHPAIEKALAELNATLRASPPKPFTVTEGGRKGKKVDFSLPSSKMEKLPSGEEVVAGALLEWEVPFDFPEDWPEAARKPFEAFHAARQAMQKRMDESIAAHADQETLYDQPQVAKNKLRITGPFTVEAVPFPTVKSLDEAAGPDEADASIARTGESGRQHQWRDELLKTGIRGRGGQVLKFADLEPLPSDPSIRHLHAVGHLDTGERVVVSFGPEHAALEQRQVAQALTEAEKLRPQPAFIVFCAFTFDPEAAKDIDETRWPGVTLLKAQMNTDLLTEDLKKARASNQSFWLMGQPDVEVRKRKDGQYEVEVHGFDYFDTVKGELVSGGKSKIAMWLLDTDYDERSLFPRQVFFPMAGKGEGWEKLKKNIRAELDESRLEAFHGTVSLPFEAGEHRKIAVKIVDDRGIESLKVIPLED